MEEEGLDIVPKRKELIIDGDRIFLAKSKFFGWNVIKPIRIDGKINWKNLIAGGSWLRLFFIIILIIIIVGCIYDYVNAVKIANQCMNDCPFIFNKNILENASMLPSF